MRQIPVPLHLQTLVTLVSPRRKKGGKATAANPDNNNNNNGTSKACSSNTAALAIAADATAKAATANSHDAANPDNNNNRPVAIQIIPKARGSNTAAAADGAREGSKALATADATFKRRNTCL